MGGRLIDQSRKRSLLACQDNTELLARIASGSVSLVLTSPPYNLGKEYEAKSGLAEYLAQQEQVIRECVRVLQPNGSICWQVGNYVDNGEVMPLDILLYPIFQQLGLKLRNRIVWHYGHGFHAQRRFSGRYETILWFTKGDYYTFDLDAVRVPSLYPNKKYYKGPRKGEVSSNPSGKNPTDVWDIPNVKANHVEKTKHPCQFPVELAERLVLALTKPGELVLDPYVGVGTTVIAARRNKRVGLGCDVVPEYIEIARSRMKLLQSKQLRVRERFTPVYKPKKALYGAAGGEVAKIHK